MKNVELTSVFKWVMSLIIVAFIGYQGWLGTQIVMIKEGQATIMERTKGLEKVEVNSIYITDLKIRVAVIEEQHQH